MNHHHLYKNNFFYNSSALSIVLFNTIPSLDPCSNKAATTALLAPPAPKTNDEPLPGIQSVYLLLILFINP